MMDKVVHSPPRRPPVHPAASQGSIQTIGWLTFVASLFMGPHVLACSHQREEPVIVFRDEEGRTLTMDELQNFAGTLRFEIVGVDGVPPEAQQLHERARGAGARGDYDEALELLNRAAELAPTWPYPVYDKAFTYLLMEENEEALRHYEQTVTLAPRGFFTAITAVDILRREKSGELGPGIYFAYLSLELMPEAQRESIVRQLTEKLPSFAPAWKDLANLAANDTERLEAIDKGLATNPDAETYGQLMIQKASTLNSQGDRDAAIRILGELSLDPRSTLATEHLAKTTLAMIVAER